jgi:aspartate/methionine/tyrosine aminotransferase
MQREALTFSLGGLSKAAGLPQLKLGWIAVGGPDDAVRAALERLEVICDTYLSVGTPVQVGLRELLQNGAAIRSSIRERVTANYRRLVQLVEGSPPVDLLPSEGGWYAVLQVPAMQSEESLVLQLLERDHVLVHPGYFFDFPREAFLVLSRLPQPAGFHRAVARLLRRVEHVA